MSTLIYLTNIDTDILVLRSIWEALPAEFPQLVVRRLEGFALGDLDGGSVGVVVRVLGGTKATPELSQWLSGLRESQVPLACFPGDAQLDSDLLDASSVEGNAWSEVFSYFVHGGPQNTKNALLRLSNLFFETSFAVEAPLEIPASGVYRSIEGVGGSLGTAVVVIYRTQLISGNVRFLDELLESLSRCGLRAHGVYVYSLRSISEHPDDIDPVALIDSLRPDVIVSTVWSGGNFDQDQGEWDPGALGRLGVPVIQGLVVSSTKSVWEESEYGLTPVDVAMSVAIPEFDGRIISVPFAFKEVVDDDDDFGEPIVAYRVDEQRCASLARLSYNYVRLRRTPNAEKKIAVMLSAYPTKKSRLGNAVGLDTPQSLVLLAKELARQGYCIEGLPEDADVLMAMLSETIDYHDPNVVIDREGAALSADVQELLRHFDSYPAKVREELVEQYGPPPGSQYVREGRYVFSGLRFGNLFVGIQPPRGFGDNPIAIYHSAVLPPTYHYLAMYHYLEYNVGVHAMIHLGKHGTLEWLPGKSVGLSESCYPDLGIGALPMFYPFVVNDPGEGTQAKRRIHGGIIDHLIPPMTAAETYGELSTLEALLDEHQRYLSLDPTKLPALRREIWEVLVSSDIAKELGLNERPNFDSSQLDEELTHVDSYLCEIKDALIRGGLHILGEVPQGEALLDLIIAMTRVPQMGHRSLREAVREHLQLPVSGDLSLGELESVTKTTTAMIRALSDHDFQVQSYDVFPPSSRDTLEWICEWLVPRLRSTTWEMVNLIGALEGRSIPPGPSGSPTRGVANVLPTGRNFYSLDPRSLPSRLSYDVGTQLANGLVERYLRETGGYPKSVGVVIWGTAAMRTGGDDISQVLALIGVRPVWDPNNAKVTGLEVIGLSELQRPRIDVTCRISGFFRDAFPQAIELLDRAFALVECLSEPAEANFLLDNVGDSRIYGPPERAYGSGVLPLLESQAWQDRKDIAEVYLTWGGHSYSHGRRGKVDRDGFERRLRRLDVASKNQDNREHDIFDSDDYLQEHGGMIATVAALTGSAPRSYFGDSSVPEKPVVRTLAQEASRVMRSRVLNPKWISAMMRHGYKGAFELAATMDYVFGYDATAEIVEDWMYEGITKAFVGDPEVRKFFEAVNPTALTSICERLLEADRRGMWRATDRSLKVIRDALLESEGWEES